MLDIRESDSAKAIWLQVVFVPLCNLRKLHRQKREICWIKVFHAKILSANLLNFSILFDIHNLENTIFISDKSKPGMILLLTKLRIHFSINYQIFKGLKLLT